MRWGNGLLCSDFHALGLSRRGRHTQGICVWKSEGRPEIFPAHLDKEPFVGTPALREVSLLLLAPSPLSQPQEGKQKPGFIPEQIFDFSFTAARKNGERSVKLELQLIVSHRKSKTIMNTRNGRSWGLNPSFPQQHDSWPLTSLALRLQHGKGGACRGKGASLKEWGRRHWLFTWREDDLGDHRWKRGWEGVTLALCTFSCKNYADGSKTNRRRSLPHSREWRCCTNITEINGRLEETYTGGPCRLETGYWVDGPLVWNHLGCSYIHTNLLKEMLPVSFATAGFTVVTHHPPHHLSLIKYLDSCRKAAQRGHKLIVYPNLIAMQSCATLDPDQVPGDN